MSVLLGPFDEMDLDTPLRGAAGARLLPPADRRPRGGRAGGGDARPRRGCAWSTTGPSWTTAVADGATALVHAVEGGCLLGDTRRGNRSQLRRAGADAASATSPSPTSSSARSRPTPTRCPSCPDSLYDFVFPQRGKDTAHPARRSGRARPGREPHPDRPQSHGPGAGSGRPSPSSTSSTPAAEMPVISTHAGYRFGKQQYMCDEEILLADQAPQGRRRADHGPAPAQRRDPQEGHHDARASRSRSSASTSTRSPRSPAATSTSRSAPISTASSNRRMGGLGDAGRPERCSRRRCASATATRTPNG